MAEIGLAFMLLAGSGLTIRTILRLWSVDPGFDPRHVLVTGVGLSPSALKNPAMIRSAWQRTVENVRRIPGVVSADVNSLVPLEGDSAELQYWAGSAAPASSRMPSALIYTPTPDYLRTMKIPLLRGRFFTEQDRLGSEPVVVIDEVAATRSFPARDPVGQKLTLQFLGPARIVGIIGHVKHSSMDEDARSHARAELYVPFAQIPDPFMRLTAGGMSLIVRTSLPAPAITGAIGEAVLGPGRDQPLYHVHTIEDTIGDSMGRRRLVLMALGGAFAIAALALSAVGIYGVVSYSTRQRLQEIGIRIALGAQAPQVLARIVRQGMAMAGAGIAIGIAGSLLVMRTIGGLLYGVAPWDPLTLIAAAVTLALIACIAIYSPARRGARVDPLIALRHE